jgi:hypothetical protein
MSLPPRSQRYTYRRESEGVANGQQNKPVNQSKIWGFHGGDYQEFRLLGRKTLVRTSQGAYYVFTTEPSELMLCKIRGFQDGGYEERRRLGCYAVRLL